MTNRFAMIFMAAVVVVCGICIIRSLRANEVTSTREIGASSYSENEEQINECLIGTEYDNESDAEDLEDDNAYADLDKEIEENSKLDTAELLEYLDDAERFDETYMKLVELSANYPLAKTILLERVRIPSSLIEFAANRPETMPYVVDYLKYGTEEGVASTSININSDYQEGDIPLFIQWDKRWGYVPYGDELMGTAGCGPTCLAMVAVGLTGDESINPLEVAELSLKEEYYFPGQGTSWALMTEGAEKLGIQGEEIGLDENTIRKCLAQGKPIIASMKPGHFTQGGHFIVLAGLDDDGSVIVNDPASKLNSDITWNMDIILPEIKNLWAYSTESK